uniref:Uncharacterized protein n=1 Tax=Rhizophora mucronata TaxID=61149 RepID=A0A2P2MZD4_RHIMU
MSGILQSYFMLLCTWCFEQIIMNQLCSSNSHNWQLLFFYFCVNFLHFKCMVG